MELRAQVEGSKGVEIEEWLLKVVRQLQALEMRCCSGRMVSFWPARLMIHGVDKDDRQRDRSQPGDWVQRLRWWPGM